MSGKGEAPACEAKLESLEREFESENEVSTLRNAFSLEPKYVKSHVSAVPIVEYIWAVHTNTPPLAKHCTAAQA